jgi:adenylylsulfate kinase
MKGQVIWITGLSGAGKTTVANALNQYLKKYGFMPILLDGDELRKVFNSKEEENGSYCREERIIISKKYSLLCKALSAQGFTVIIATVSMFNEIYAWNRINLPNYFEVYLDVPLQELNRRDPKQIYSKFNSGLIKNVSGLDLQVDRPTKADLTVIFQKDQTPNKIIDTIIEKLELK